MPQNETSTLARWMRYAATAMWWTIPILLAVSRGMADVCVVAIAVLFLLHSVLTRNWQWFRQAEVKLILGLWFVLLALSGLTPVDPYKSFIAALIWGRFAVFYVGIRYWIASPHTLQFANTLNVGVILAIMIDAFWQYKTGVSLSGHHTYGRLSGPLSHPNAGNLLLKLGIPVIGMSMYRLLQERDRKMLVGMILVIFSIVSVVTVSGERSTTILLLVSVIIAGAGLFVFQPTMRKGVVVCELVIAAILYYLLRSQPSVQARAQQFGEQVSDFWHTTYGQLYIAAAKLWQEYPLTGIGPQRFWDVCKLHMEQMGVTYCDMHPHNTYLEWLVAGGTIGFVLFLSAMAVIIWKGVSSFTSFDGYKPVLAIFAFAAFAVLLFPAVATQSQYANWPAIVYWYTMSMAASMHLLQHSTDKGRA